MSEESEGSGLSEDINPEEYVPVQWDEDVVDLEFKSGHFCLIFFNPSLIPF